MLEFNRLNCLQLAREFDVHYYTVDIFRQTTIERLIASSNKASNNKEDTITAILTMARFMLDRMIKEVK